VGPRGIYIGPGYIKDIKNWPRPKNKKEVERFFGFTNYHRAFIEEVNPSAPG
jgi:pterin-4a-carbinolamine dehydratase